MNFFILISFDFAELSLNFETEGNSGNFRFLNFIFNYTNKIVARLQLRKMPGIREVAWIPHKLN